MSDRSIILHEELHALVDGQLPAERHADVLAWLEAHPEDAERVAAWRAQRAALREAFGQVPPHSSRFDLLRLAEERLRPTVRFPWRAAAAVLLALCVGGAAGWTLRAVPPDRSALALSVLEQEAFATHAVYAPDRRHPIEVDAGQRDHLATWLSNRLNRKIAPPDLSAAGWRLLGGRLLATERGGAAALFMYDNAQGQRLSLVMRPMSADLLTPEVEREGGSLNSFAWIEGGLGYAVVAATPKQDLLEVSRMVKQQQPV